MNITAINTLARLLDNIPSKFDTGFNMGGYIRDVRDELEFGDEVKTHVGHQCGTTACIAGWASLHVTKEGTLLSKGRTSNEIYEVADELDGTDLSTYATAAQNILGLDDDQAALLFEPMNFGDHGNHDWDEVTPRQAAKVLRHLVKTGDVDWGVAFK